MKWAISLVLLGIAEVYTISELHGFFGTAKLVSFYIATTAIGAIFLYIQLPLFRESMKAMKGIEKKFKKKIKKQGYELTPEDYQKAKPMLFLSIYVFGFVLIAIPGVLSDIIGTIIVFPYFSKLLLEYKMRKVVEKSETSKMP